MMKGCPIWFFKALILLHNLLRTESKTHSNSLHHNDSAPTEAISQLPREPTYFVLSSEALEPGQDYQLIVSLFKAQRSHHSHAHSLPSFPHSVKAEIWREGSPLASKIIDAYSGMTVSMTINLPEHVFYSHSLSP
eukprot:TRINITY_DN22339_c0_g1_i1.p1 TRINITY_DN22339_c0_g1~~TRINITY_DN22339_c0_g1_i1.p1  ORF type:complete len:135 (-),score=20.39 TRINITY_DN22339_c0_g1_i1:247-651(-)